MNSHPQINSHWLSRLAEEYPESANQLSTLAEHLFAKQERLAALIRFCATHPELPMMRMYAEYNSALDAVALEPPREEVRELSDEEIAGLDAHARAARTKRVRTRTNTTKAALRFLLERPLWRMDELAEEAGVGVATIHHHFRSRSAVIVAAYNHLLAGGK